MHAILVVSGIIEPFSIRSFEFSIAPRFKARQIMICATHAQIYIFRSNYIRFLVFLLLSSSSLSLPSSLSPNLNIECDLENYPKLWSMYLNEFCFCVGCRPICFEYCVFTRYRNLECIKHKIQFMFMFETTRDDHDSGMFGLYRNRFRTWMLILQC